MALFLLLIVLVKFGLSIASSDCQQLLIPAYFYPKTWLPSQNLWTNLTASGTTGIVIMNPSNGPENVVNSDYLTASQDAAASGWTIIGYISHVFPSPL